MDYLRSNLPAGTWLANEIDAPSRGTNAQYYNQAAKSYSHGCTLISVANWEHDSLVNRTSLFAKIAKDFLQGPTPAPPPIGGAMNLSATVIFKAGMVPGYRPPQYGADMVLEYQRLSKNGTLWLDVKLLLDLDHQPLCNDISGDESTSDDDSAFNRAVIAPEDDINYDGELELTTVLFDRVWTVARPVSADTLLLSYTEHSCMGVQ